MAQSKEVPRRMLLPSLKDMSSELKTHMLTSKAEAQGGGAGKAVAPPSVHFLHCQIWKWSHSQSPHSRVLSKVIPLASNHVGNS